ncbi:MAG: LysE family transporter [Holophaga sp.]|nr:LysE family transporter [Holophaga sp.]
MVVAILVGFAFGFIGSMPVAGPIALLVLRLGLNRDPRHARLVAIGGAFAEGIYSLAAFWGLSEILDRYPRVLPASRIVGAVLCLALGIVLLLHKPKPGPPPGQPERRKGTKRSLLGGFLLTALNPTLLVTWTAALAALHATGLVTLSSERAVPFALAVFLGIVCWFSTLLWLVRRFKGRWSPASVEWFIKGMGAVLVGAAGVVLLRALIG